MNDIETLSTSQVTADCSPIPLRETERVRLVFVPTLVDNANNPAACVRGHFVYQRKTKHNEWEPIPTIPLSRLKSGEGYKLELHSSELLTFRRQLSPLYGIYRQHGIPRGRARFVKLEASLARFFALSKADLSAFLESHSDDAADVLSKLVGWMATSAKGRKTASRLAGVDPSKLPDLTALLGLVALKDALEYWTANESNSSELFWQVALAERAYVLSQVFAYPVVVVQSKAYVGGKCITNEGGNVVDFLGAVESTDAVVLIEIKTPSTKLLGREYRAGAFPISPEIVGSVIQVLRYRQSLMNEYQRLFANRPRPPTIAEPRCLVVAGDAGKELTTPAMRESFELQRERLQGVSVVTYDELFGRLGRVVALLEREEES